MVLSLISSCCFDVKLIYIYIYIYILLSLTSFTLAGRGRAVAAGGLHARWEGNERHNGGEEFVDIFTLPFRPRVLFELSV